MSEVRRVIQDLPPVPRHALLGALVLGAVGAVVGLVLGLHANVGTAWAATVEVGLPAAVLGATIGAVGSLAARLWRRGPRRD